MKSFLKKQYSLYVKRPIAQIKFSRPVWLWRNRKSRSLYEKNQPVLNPLQKKIVAELKKDGISIVHVTELFSDQPDIYNSILAQLPNFLAGAKQDPKKAHFRALWDTRSFFLDPGNSFVRFALADRIIDIANSYFGMWTRLLLANGYIADVVPPSDAKINTQNWHRDAHDIQLLSVFIYLTDVNSEKDGAFWFVKDSHPFGKLKSLFSQPKPHSLRKFPTEEVVNAGIKEEDKVLCLGKKGTVIFSDATAIHRGGHCTANPRIMVLTVYASDKRFSETLRLSYPENTEKLKSILSPQGQYAAKLI